MNEKEIAELRRRFRADKNAIPRVCGCYVNEEGRIVSRFDQSFLLMPQEESEQLLGILRKTLSGTLGKNLLDISFDTRQVADGAEHRLLMALRDSSLQDEEAVQTLFQQIVRSLDLPGNYLILLTCDTYDVPYRSKDGERQDEASTEVFRYILCSICPVKPTKAALSYYVDERAFHALAADWVLAAPEVGFLFPAFNERSTDLYGALYYTKDTSQAHADFIETLFRAPAPMPADEQQDTFQTILGDTLAEDCSYQAVRSVHERLCGLIEEHKENKVEEPLTVSRDAMKRILTDCGVEDRHIDAFEARYDAAFGAETDLSPRNIADTKQLEIATQDVTVRVAPDRGDLVGTRIIDGARYLLIRCESDVTVNGIPVQIK